MSGAKYCTKQRELIYNFLATHHQEHISVDQIVDYLKRQGTTVGTTTVYRFLSLLEQNGEVRKYPHPDGGCACYQFIKEQNCHLHYHLKCNVCGELLHIQCEHLDRIQQTMLHAHQFELDTLKTVFYGTCGRCQKAAQ